MVPESYLFSGRRSFNEQGYKSFLKYVGPSVIGISSWLIYGDSFLALPLCLYTLPLFFGIDGVWLAMPASRLILMGMLCYFWFGYRRNRS